MTKNFKILKEKVIILEGKISKMEIENHSKESENGKISERLVNIESNQQKDCVLQKPFEEQKINITNTYNILEEMISSNTNNLTKIEDDLRKKNKVDES